VGFVDHQSHFVVGEIAGLDVRAERQYSAAGHDLDDVGAPLGALPHRVDDRVTALDRAAHVRAVTTR
jgi:hypothetical protein